MIDSLQMAEPKARLFSELLRAIKVDQTALVALPADGAASRAARLAAQNLEDVTLCRSDSLNCFEMLNHRYLVIGKEDLLAWLKGPSAQTGKSAKLEPLGADRAEARSSDSDAEAERVARNDRRAKARARALARKIELRKARVASMPKEAM
ncbi:50S ribosomal protein L4 [Leptolyngbya sp. 15MV]|nr:50S ribosomal protein L4 [Leptolyngbya sp. 15MV]